MQPGLLSLSFALILLAERGKPAPDPQLITRVYMDASGYVHMVDSAGSDFQIPGEKEQVKAEDPVVAEDRQTVGWRVYTPNCCTSYPIPTTLVIKSGETIHRINDGWMIYKWRFLDRGQRIAISSGTVHGMTKVHLTLYDSRTGRLLKTWDGKFGDTPPKWGAGVVE